jgi:hypothetical protein
MSAFQMFKSAKVRRLEKELIAADEDYNRLSDLLNERMDASTRIAKHNVELRADLADLAEARDAVSAGAKFLRNKVDMQSAVLNMIATYGTDNPTWAAKIAKAAVEGEK